jgi:hypothetical protein
MKKIGSIFLVILIITVNLAMASTPAINNSDSTPLSSQEMSSIIGGKTSCGCGGGACCCCLNLWIIELCGCFFY